MVSSLRSMRRRLRLPWPATMTSTRSPGLNPARSSQRPFRRIFGVTLPSHGSPVASTASCRDSGISVFALEHDCEHRLRRVSGTDQSPEMKRCWPAVTLYVHAHLEVNPVG